MRGAWLLMLCMAAWSAPARADIPWNGYLLPNSSNNPFEYYVDGRFPAGAGGVTQSSAEAATQAAFQAWEAVACAWPDFTFKGLATANPAIADPRDPYDAFNVSTVWTNDPADPYYDFALAGGRALAAALPLTYAGNVYQCDIYANGVGNPFSAATPTPGQLYDLQSILVHEVGHCLGLGHTGDDSSVMFPTLDTGVQLRTAQQLDATTLCALYPQTGAVGSPCTPGGAACGGGLTCIQAPRADGTPGPAFCSRGCDPSPGINGPCSAPWVCKASNLVPNSAGACLPSYGDAVTQVGKPCAYDADCGSPLGFCQKESFLPSGAPAWNDGACSQPCGPGRPDCPAGSTCADFGGGMVQCVQTCRLGTGDCRAGYACVFVAQGYPALCLSACASDADCNGGQPTGEYLCRPCDGLCLNRQNGASSVGAPCVATADCGTGQVCVKLTAGDATAGICSQTCADACSSCPSGTACHPLGVDGTPWCLPECQVGSCPSGQRCALLATGRACVPACTFQEECPLGTACIGGECVDPDQLDGGCALCNGRDAGNPNPVGGGRRDAGTGSGSAGSCGCTGAPGGAWVAAAWWFACHTRRRRWAR
ncbi:MAG: hypothetical protein RL653_2638 [Pseudomonadota bacterium]